MCVFLSLCFLFVFFFFFQAEDGIRDADVTGVQTCALPISDAGPDRRAVPMSVPTHWVRTDDACRVLLAADGALLCPVHTGVPRPTPSRSEERRVGKECRSRWAPYH